MLTNKIWHGLPKAELLWMFLLKKRIKYNAESMLKITRSTRLLVLKVSIRHQIQARHSSK